jgi:hypothetical protein
MSFETLTEKLNTAMKEEYVSVSKEKNPVYAQLSAMPQMRLSQITAQYVKFPQDIVCFLYNAGEAARINGWDEFAQEMDRNRSEEEGSDSQGVAHYDMLMQGIRETTKRDFKTIKRSDEYRNRTDATRAFVKAMLHHTKYTDHSMPYIAGATYALESTAVPELEIVQEMVRELTARTTGERKFSPLLQRFFDGHLQTWEVGHESRLRDACAKYVTPEMAAEFECGFRATMHTMDCWWNSLAGYSYRT